MSGGELWVSADPRLGPQARAHVGAPGPSGFSEPVPNCGREGRLGTLRLVSPGHVLFSGLCFLVPPQGQRSRDFHGPCGGDGGCVQSAGRSFQSHVSLLFCPEHLKTLQRVSISQDRPFLRPTARDTHGGLAAAGDTHEGPGPVLGLSRPWAPPTRAPCGTTGTLWQTHNFCEMQQGWSEDWR